MKSPIPFIDPRVKDAMEEFQKMTDSDVRSMLWGIACFKECKLVYAAPGKTIHHVTVTKEMTNFTDTLHGGCSATLVDM
jgi:acyl-coenzyme A thioesterase PaaI-like protein